MAELHPVVLIVEDEPEIRRFLRAAFGVEGYRVVESATGRRGSIDARTHKPDLAIVDLALPDIDGIEVIRRIREWSPMPIIVLSAGMPLAPLCFAQMRPAASLDSEAPFCA